jgi:hypothetical protein
MELISVISFGLIILLESECVYVSILTMIENIKVLYNLALF